MGTRWGAMTSSCYAEQRSGLPQPAGGGMVAELRRPDEAWGAGVGGQWSQEEEEQFYDGWMTDGQEDDTWEKLHPRTEGKPSPVRRWVDRREEEEEEMESEHEYARLVGEGQSTLQEDVSEDHAVEEETKRCWKKAVQEGEFGEVIEYDANEDQGGDVLEGCDNDEVILEREDDADGDAEGMEVTLEREEEDELDADTEEMWTHMGCHSPEMKQVENSDEENKNVYNQERAKKRVIVTVKACDRCGRLADKVTYDEENKVWMCLGTCGGEAEEAEKQEPGAVEAEVTETMQQGNKKDFVTDL
jgi:hypothetical protein